MSTETRIENWSTTMECPHNPYRAPEQDPHLHLQGDVAGRSGPVVTSRIIGSSGRVVMTKSGSRYRLGRPAPAFMAWLREHGKVYDRAWPVKLHQGRPSAGPALVEGSGDRG